MSQRTHKTQQEASRRQKKNSDFTKKKSWKLNLWLPDHLKSFQKKLKRTKDHLRGVMEANGYHWENTGGINGTGIFFWNALKKSFFDGSFFDHFSRILTLNK